MHHYKEEVITTVYILYDIGAKMSAKPKSTKQYPVPPDLPKIIRRFTKEVLKRQPKDIYKFGRNEYSIIICIYTV